MVWLSLSHIQTLFLLTGNIIWAAHPFDCLWPEHTEIISVVKAKKSLNLCLNTACSLSWSESTLTLWLRTKKQAPLWHSAVTLHHSHSQFIRFGWYCGPFFSVAFSFHEISCHNILFHPHLEPIVVFESIHNCLKCLPCLVSWWLESIPAHVG